MKPLNYRPVQGAKCDVCGKPATVVVSVRVTATHCRSPFKYKPASNDPAVTVVAGHSHVYCHACCPAHVRADVTAPVETCPLPAGPAG